MAYHIKSHVNTDTIFPTVDATYIIHLRGNGRYKNVKKQLKQYPLTKNVHIVVNKGYKKFKKPNIDSPAKDLIHAYMFCFEHAKQYNNILILEDDFIIDPSLYKHKDNINTFVKSHIDFAYRLGCIPFVMIPYDTHNYIGLTLGAHAIMYSTSVRTQLLENQNEIYKCDYDLYLNYYFNYIYCTPVIYQLYPETENQKKWGEFSLPTKIVGYILKYLLKLLLLDKQVNPGYNFFYFISKYLFILLFILLFIIYFK